MLTEDVQATVSILTENNQQINNYSQNLKSSIENLRSTWQGPSSDMFLEESQVLLSKLITQNDTLQELIGKLKNEMLEWESMSAHLSLGGSNTSQVSVSNQAQTPIPVSETIPTGSPAVGTVAAGVVGVGAVAGTTSAAVVDKSGTVASGAMAFTPGAFLKQYQSLSWSKKFTEETSILSQIAALEKKKASSAGLSQSEQNKLAELLARKSAIQTVINSGISDKPTRTSLSKVLGGCTNYVATKRNVEPFFKGGHMNATYWNENAASSGFDVGTRPVKGAIMVIEADNGRNNGVMNVSDTAGHVAYVESAKAVKGGYSVVVSQANTKYTSSGGYVAGTYINKNTKTIFVPTSNKSVSFIYTKK
jgi:surface antigen/uncharacterized protein YukE